MVSGGARISRTDLSRRVAVGTNDGKDYPSLVEALPPGVHCLIVTDEANATEARRVAEPGALVSFDAAVPISLLRHLYRAASVQVIPLRDVRFSSGQTVLLENFAAGARSSPRMCPRSRITCARM